LIQLVNQVCYFNWKIKRLVIIIILIFHNKKDLLGKVLLFSQNKNYLIGVDNKNRIKLWNKSSFNNYSNINQFNKTIKSFALLENNLLAIASCDINKIDIWNVTNNSKIFDLNDHTDCVNTLISINLINKTFLISGSDDTTIRLYDSFLITFRQSMIIQLRF